MAITKQNKGFSITAYRGDAKTLLAFNLPKARAQNLAGFTIQCQPDGQQPYYLHNQLQFKDPSQHAHNDKQPANSSFNAPIHKFRWLHVPGSVHQGTKPFYGKYAYTVTPRYFNNGSLQAIDANLSVSVALKVCPFAKKKLRLGFTRGFTQSQAFVHHFGVKTTFRPKEKELLFDTSQVSGTNPSGQSYTFAEEYEWLGFTARGKTFDLLNEVLSNKTLHLDAFAYDLNEPEVMNILLVLAKQGRVRLILDNASLHHNPTSPKPEDEFEKLFTKAATPPAAILRGKFGRYAHDKVFVLSNANRALKVLTGSTNFSITGLYVNSNHVLVFDDNKVASAYQQVFNESWNAKVSSKFKQSPLAGKVFSFSSATVPQVDITFSPHQNPFAEQNLDKMAGRIDKEGKKNNGSVLFAVMGLDSGTGPILPALREIHANQNIFSYGISDSPGGIYLYSPRQKTGVLVTGKPAKTKLPPPFDQVPSLGLEHQIHHKFVVCGFNGDDPVVYCGSSNLALLGEENNGDNLIAIYDQDIATVFALEALALVDHFDFLDRASSKASEHPGKIKSASKSQLAIAAGWFLSTTDRWTIPYFEPNDLRFVDRELFG